MPGRVSTRSSRSSVAPRPPSTSRNSRASATAARPELSARALEEPPSTALRLKICSIFAESQRNIASHRKLVINLRKVQEKCCYESSKSQHAKSPSCSEEYGEAGFNEEIKRCLIRILPVKKAESAADKVIRFLGLFLKHASEKDNALLAETEGEQQDVIPETPTSRLASRIFITLLPLLVSKEKAVRYRSTQIISHIINSLDSIDDELFERLRLALLKRIRDKESMVRVQAVLGLGRLAGNEAEAEDEDEDSADDTGGGTIKKLLVVLQNDPSADVRRSLLLNLPLTPETLPILLERARDQDVATRRALYTRLLPSLGDFRHLSLVMREKLLRWGLRDRDENVRKATTKLFRERWIEDCAGSRQEAETSTEAAAEEAPPNFDGLTELLERIDVVNSGVEKGVALEAMKGFWEGRIDYREAVTFDDAYWENLTAESIFMARSFNDFCRQEPNGVHENLVEEKMPEVTKLAFFLQKYTNQLIAKIRQSAEETDRDVEDEVDEDMVEQEFIVEQLLHIAQTLDYTDEVGRRKMFALLRETLAIAELPEDITRLVVEVLRGLCRNDSAGERDFCSIVLEAIAEVHDTIVGDEPPGDESFHSAKSELSDATPTKVKNRGKSSLGGGDSEDDAVMKDAKEVDEERAIQEIMVNMKCLHIAQCMLENVQGSLQSNMHLATMVNNLVVPAIQSHEAPIRERGLICLGLCCLLDKRLSEENLPLFRHCFAKGHEALQISALQIISDILTVHSTHLLPPSSDATDLEKALHKIFLKALKPSAPPAVQSTAATALSKLLLNTLLHTPPLLQFLITSYFDPSTASNLELRQTLSYVLPVFSHSRATNQQLTARVTSSTLQALASLREEIEDDDDADALAEPMVPLSVVAAHLVEWTDPRKLVTPHAAEGKEAPNAGIQLSVAADVLARLESGGASKDEARALAGVLPKLYVPHTAALARVHAEEMSSLGERAGRLVLGDAVARNAVAKFVAAVEKVLAKIGGVRERSGSVLEEAGAVGEVEAGMAGLDVSGESGGEVSAQIEREMARVGVEEEEVEEEEEDEVL
ncbi:MAG: hypothetical protein M1829_005682 [Trizodia sp. TS-e1964]|nr:MAG: hypothetical protein M1829_005682 [Trizodia sp. TS-e1964]